MVSYFKRLTFYIILIGTLIFPGFVNAIEIEATTVLTEKKYPANDPYYEEQWYLDKINISDAWKYTTGSAKVIVAVVDSGVDIDHPDLKSNIWINQNEKIDGIDNDKNGYVDDINGWDFIKNLPDPKPKIISDDFTEEGVNHGTIVAGVIAAKGNNKIGISGISWHSKIMPLRVLDSQGNGDISEVIEAIDYAINNGADIINLSFVGSKSDPRLAEAIKRADSKGVIIVSAAGNEGFADLDSQFLAYEKKYQGGIKIAAGDIDNDGQVEIVVAPAEDYLPLIKIFDAQGKAENQFFAYAEHFRGGVNVAVGDINGDGVDEIITGAGYTGGPHVRIFDAKGNLKGQFFAYAEHFRGGVNVAVGDINGDGIDEIIAGAGYTGGPHVRIFDANGNVQTNFFAFADHLRSGVNVAAGEIVSVGRSEIISGAGKGAPAYVRIKSLSNKQVGINLNKFPLYPACYNAIGNNLIGVASTDADGRRSIFSNYGNNCVNFAVPGEFFFGLKSELIDSDNAYYGGYWSGTSLAAPVVSGTIALMKSIKNNLTPDEIVIILARGSDKSKLNENEVLYGNIDVGKVIEGVRAMLKD